MIRFIIEVVIALASPTTAELARGAQQTAPQYLDHDAALEHATAAVIASVVYRVPPELLLSIAHHESRYNHATLTPEVGGKVSCGVMTPEPMQESDRCSVASSSPLYGYLHGAQHLRVWLNATRGNIRAALLGYAGGYRMIRACEQGPILRMRGAELRDLCLTPERFTSRAARIRRVGAGV